MNLEQAREELKLADRKAATATGFMLSVQMAKDMTDEESMKSLRIATMELYSAWVHLKRVISAIGSGATDQETDQE